MSSTAATSSPAARRSATTNSSSTSSTSNVEPKARSPTPSSGPALNGATRTRALNKGSISGPTSAKAAARKPATSTGTKDSEKNEDDSRAETTALIDDLKAQLRKAELVSEEYEKQLHVLQARLDEAIGDQGKMEEFTSAHEEQIETLQMEKKEALKQKKELEAHIEADREANNREREEAAIREEELNGIIKRLKESMYQREPRKSVDATGSPISRNTSFRGRSSPNPEVANTIESPLARRDSSQGSKLVLHKDKVIEELRLELAEAQIRLVEMENAGGGRVRELEKTLLETRMVNAKLMEDNESYQYLLSEKTLNGDLSRGGVFHTTEEKLSSTAPRTPSQQANNSLADELETADDKTEIPVETASKDQLEAEVNALRDQNKALTLYINKIITKLLQNDQFEEFFENGKITGETNPTAAAAAAAKPQTQKDLPKIPVEEADKENAGPSLLQRAGSLFGGRTRPRPRSTIAPSSTSDAQHAVSALLPENDNLRPISNLTENPQTAPSVPIKLGDSSRGHSHRRSKSEWSANIASTMYRGPPIGSPNEQPSSPTFSPPTSQPFILEETTPLEHMRTTDSITSAASGDTTVQHMPSASASDGGSRPTSDDLSVLSTSPRSVAQSTSTDGRSSANMSVGTGGTVFSSTSGGMRPLRLVQEKDKADEAAAAAERERKKANRTSFMGWFQRPGSGQILPPPTSNYTVPDSRMSTDGRPTTQE